MPFKLLHISKSIEIWWIVYKISVKATESADEFDTSEVVADYSYVPLKLSLNNRSVLWFLLLPNSIVHQNYNSIWNNLCSLLSYHLKRRISGLVAKKWVWNEYVESISSCLSFNWKCFASMYVCLLCKTISLYRPGHFPVFLPDVLSLGTSTFSLFILFFIFPLFLRLFPSLLPSSRIDCKRLTFPISCWNSAVNDTHILVCTRKLPVSLLI